MTLEAASGIVAPAMALRAITVENYRCYREPFRLDLRPLTLLYGWNNAGKSTAARLIRALGRSVDERARAPLDTGDGLGYRDLVWKPAVTKPGALRFGLEWQDVSGGPINTARWRLDLDRDTGRMYVRELDLTGLEDFHIRADRSGAPEFYDMPSSEGSSRLQLSFSGLVPNSDLQELAALRERLVALRDRCEWLRGDRVRPPRSIPSDAPPPRSIGEDGDGALGLLVDPANQDILATVSEWYARPAIARTLKRSDQESLRRLLLNPVSALFDVDLADTGAGMSQVLPVLVAVASAQKRARAAEPALLAIEEPESQLHPNAQRALGEWLCEVARADAAPQLVLETHSRVLILAVQLAVARGLDPQRVALYWLEQRADGSTHAREVTLDRFGRPDSQWPRDVFADELELADLLAEQQFSRGAWG